MKENFIRGFRDELCCDCGACLKNCIYVPIGDDEAVFEHRELMIGGIARNVMKHCIGCGACDNFCPKGAHPYFLILNRLHKRNIERGLPERARFFMPTLPNNFRHFMIRRMREFERAIVEDWENQRPAEEFIYPGCNFITLAYLSKSPPFERLKISGSLKLCCGEMYFRLGMFEMVREIGKRLRDYFSGFRIKRVIYICPACQNMFQNIYPLHFGIKFDFEKVSFARWMLENWYDFRLSVIDAEVVVQDSCHGRMLGVEYQRDVRSVLKLLGLTLREMTDDLRRGPCCGIGAAAIRFSVIDVLRCGMKVFSKSRRLGAREIVTYCGGCFITLNAVGLFLSPGTRVRHVLEYVCLSAGVNPQITGRKKALELIIGIISNVFPVYFSRRRFFL